MTPGNLRNPIVTKIMVNKEYSRLLALGTLPEFPSFQELGNLRDRGRVIRPEEAKCHNFHLVYKLRQGNYPLSNKTVHSGGN